MVDFYGFDCFDSNPVDGNRVSAIGGAGTSDQKEDYTTLYGFRSFKRTP